jgi:alginate O-acetyltransferase complex protein AlgI
MVFSSPVFLFIFLPVTYILYLLCPGIRVKNILLIIVSLFFYAFGEPVFVLVMLVSVIGNYLFGIGAARPGTVGSRWMAAAVVFNVAILGTLKYADFVVSNLDLLPHVSIPDPNIPLPIGISFFTFQALSYVIDVYREKPEKQESFMNVLLYICFFPQLIAGPIIKYGDIREELNMRHPDARETAEGIRRFICGLSKKLIIANTLGAVADSVFAMSHVNMPLAWLGGVSYLFQIYFDFSGYSDMALGLGKMFGFHYKENFNYPYISTSIREFWRRWHISLSSWFRDYMYIPLGGNRKGEKRTYINKYFVFFITGLWHGANWTFVLWGLLHGTMVVLEDAGIIPRKKMDGRLSGHIYTMIVVTCAFVIFRADTVTQGLTMILAMFTGFHFETPLMTALMAQLSPLVIMALILGVVFSCPVEQKFQSWMYARQREDCWEILSYAGVLVLLALCVMNLSSGSFNPFIYFRF